MTKVEALRLWSQKISEGVMPAYNPSNGTCLYRDGHKQCAVGVLIPMDVLREDEPGDILNLAVREIYPLLIERGFDVLQTIDGATFADLQEIQSAHDRASDAVSDFRILFFDRLHSLHFFKDVPADVWDDVMGVSC